MVLSKIFGIGLMLLGVAIIIFFPYTEKHQPSSMTSAGIIIGIIVLGLGLLLFNL